MTLCLSVLGALLAAIASQITSETSRFYIAIGGAMLLAVVGFLTSRLMGSEHNVGRGEGARCLIGSSAKLFKFAAWAAALR